MASTALHSAPPFAPSRAFARQIDWPVLLGLALFVVILRGYSFGNPVNDFDDQLYSFIGGRMLHGELPFVDWFDRKPFGLFAIFAIAHLFGGPSSMAYQGLAMAFVLGGGFLTYHLARPMADRLGAAIAGCFYVVLITLFAGPSGQSEAFFVPIMLLAAALVRDCERPDADGRGLAAMALCGIALQIKYTVLPQCAFLGAWVLWGQFRRGAGVAKLASNAAAYAALGIAPTAMVGLLYFAAGGWDQFWFANFESFFLRNPAYASRFHPRQIPWAVVLAVPLFGAGYYSFRVAAPRDIPRYAFYALWSLSMLATVLLPQTIYAYYLGALAPCIALLATPFYARATIAGSSPALMLLAAYLYMFNLPDRYEVQLAERRDFAQFSREVARHVDGSDRCLYVYDGPTALYRTSGGCTMTRYIYPDHLNNALETGALGVDQTAELTRILADHPAIIVTASRPVTQPNLDTDRIIQRAVRDYHPIAHTLIGTRIITAWAQREPALSGPDTTATSLTR
jgi:hypothetical protein